jgi:hypothetical protein
MAARDEAHLTRVGIEDGREARHRQLTAADATHRCIERRDQARQLESLAENTNGTAIVPESLDEMVEKTAVIAKLIDASYAVTYIPKVPIATGSRVTERKIEVTSKRPGLQVQARRKLFVDRRQ